jgi:hypothetical protein
MLLRRVCVGGRGVTPISWPDIDSNECTQVLLMGARCKAVDGCGVQVVQGMRDIRGLHCQHRDVGTQC